MESIGDGVFAIDTEGRIILWNPAMEHITGYLAEEAIGEGCKILGFNNCFGKECPKDFTECGILEKGKIEPTECMLHHKDGHEVNVIKNVRVIKQEDGSIIGIVEAITDLTELNNIKLKMKEATRRYEELFQFGRIIGKSNVMQDVFSSIKASAASEATILIQGESGTGKELVAHAIHSASERKDKPLVIVNCSALSESLLESELFGHVKGAFTGAIRDRAGRFEEANEGTVFLDEIGDISSFIQLKLLRVLQQQEIERVGESRKRKVNIRIIAATNKDLYNLVQEGGFREDLFYRLKVFPIYLPPLRKRKEDISLLVNHFINIHNKNTGKTIQGVLPPVMRIFMDYPWPGNVRELGNAIEHAFVLCDGDQIDVYDLPMEMRPTELQSVPLELYRPSQSALLRRKNLDREKLLDLLKGCGWNKAEVARKLGLSRASIWKYMKKWDIPLKMNAS
jgi:PAS domain S-box-containing protein